MSQASTHAANEDPSKGLPPETDGHSHEEGHHDHGKYPFLAHHFDTPQQQFDAGKLGIWLFLVTEVLFFAGLFCAYTIYRAQHPEVFYYAHFHLDTTMGAVNTVVLLVSSLTAAWAVRSAQLRNKAALMLNITITIVCACVFMGVKYVEYSHKFHDGLLPGKRFAPTQMIWELPVFKEKHPETAKALKQLEAIATDPGKRAEAPPVEEAQQAFVSRLSPEVVKPMVSAGLVNPKTMEVNLKPPARTATFFGIYFFMTGLHGLHVTIGIGIFIWLLWRASKGIFNKNYFGPIDYAALYWHLVDLIWIYLFPLLYLIH